jgi:hypothetical protein
LKKLYKIIILLILILFFELSFIIKGIISNSTVKGNNSNGQVVIVIDINSNYLSVFNKGKIVKTFPIASGKEATPSPIGTWKVINKGTWNQGFGGRWIGLNVPWGTYGIHGTTSPYSIGHSASHGCIRMKNKDVVELYDMISIGDSVIIWGGPYGYFGDYLRTIRPGDIGADVYEIQKMLKSKGYFKGTPNGIYDENMKNLLHKYQQDNNLPIRDNVTLKFYYSLGVYLMD